MTKPNKKSIGILILIIVPLLIAYIFRIPGLFHHFSRQMGLVRSAIYISLFFVWGVSVRSRIIQVQVRRYMTAIAALMVFWFFARTLKFLFFSWEIYPNVSRYLWYSYYLGMLFIPLLAVFVAMSIGKPENYRLTRKATLLYIPTTLLFLLVMTNDLHQLVFTFPENAKVWTDNEYGYSVGYYFLVIWMVLCAIIMLVELCRKRRVAGSRRMILIPCIPIVVLLLYLLLYCLGSKWLSFIAGDMTAVMCLMYVLTLELCIWCGFIQANTHYMELFAASTIGAQITDNEYHVVLSSGAAKTVDMETLRQTEQAPVMLEGGIRLSGAPLKNGHVVWMEDMSKRLKVLEELKEAKEELEDSNSILEEENIVKARNARVAEQNCLFDTIQRDTAGQIDLMERLIEQVEKAGTEEAARQLLYKMLVIGAYLKRRSNLVFLSNGTSMLDARELVLTFGESLDNLELYGVACGFYSELRDEIPSIQVIAMYDFFEKIVERGLDDMEALTVYAKKMDNAVILTVNTDSASDFYDLASHMVSVQRDEDGEWQLTLMQRTGGYGL